MRFLYSNATKRVFHVISKNLYYLITFDVFKCPRCCDQVCISKRDIKQLISHRFQFGFISRLDARRNNEAAVDEVRC